MTDSAAEALGGHPEVDAARARLDQLDTAPVEDHVEILSEVQRRLDTALAELDVEQ